MCFTIGVVTDKQIRVKTNKINYHTIKAFFIKMSLKGGVCDFGKTGRGPII